MDTALQYLSKYLAEPKIPTNLRADDPLMADLPEWWRKVLLADGEDRIRQTLLAWKDFQVQLPSVFKFLSAHLRTVNLLTYKNRVTGKMSVRLLYGLERGDRIMYYAGGNPHQKSMTAPVREAWDKLPADFRRFYDSLHNGWYYLASESMGPASTEAFFILDDSEWGILDDIGDPGCDLKDLLAVYSNGMGDYVALSIEKNTTYGDVLWWKAKRPELNIDVWAVIDAWTEIGLNN